MWIQPEGCTNRNHDVTLQVEHKVLVDYKNLCHKCKNESQAYSKVEYAWAVITAHKLSMCRSLHYVPVNNYGSI